MQLKSGSAAVSNLQNEKFASIAHDIATSTQMSRVQTRGLKRAYAEGWYVERNLYTRIISLKAKQPANMYHAFAIARPVQVDLIQRHWSGAPNPTHCHWRHKCRTLHQQCQRTPRSTESTDHVGNSNRDYNSHDFVIPLDAS
jgi:hypothetical protein